MKNKGTILISHIILFSAVIVTLFPVFYTLSSSFKTNMEIMTEPARMIPKEFTFDNYIRAWTSEEFNVPRMLGNSLYYTVSCVIMNLFISSMVGYVFARAQFPGKTFVFACFTSLMFIKGGGIGIYPKFEILNALHIDSGIHALVFLNLFGVPITNFFIVKSFVQSLPIELDEAAEIDGCNFMTIFFKIIMPLLLPVMATIGIFSFNASWNAYLMPTIFTTTKPEQQTLMVGLMALKSSSGAATNWALMMAGSVIALIPVLIAYAFGNRFFVSGLSAGAVKG